ncbi:ABC transporter substrate-binding protein [uncultured Amphritea sp.]|uniref:ABC transporter substrate-binding protein n=1 Tax=uncultured Amphritea sp. TaxID=981605 RepID=UPI00260B916D|nr:ABC transporter substrate-binding protein [uncultured Amphritea sp.]
MKKLIAASLMVLAAGQVQAADECGKVTIADMNWSSATLISNVDKFILQNGYGCDAELVPGDTMPTGTSMIEKGEPDIAPEMWSNSMRDALDKGVAEKRLRYAGNSLSDGGEEGFWVPQYLVKKYPELATIEGVKKHAKLFTHPEDDSKSAFYGCPAGWNCQISASNLFKALKLADSGFDLIDPGSGAGLAGSIAKAFTREEPWFGYYWAPTAVLGKYKMVKVDFGSGVDKQHYIDCISANECADPKPTMYPPSLVQTVTTESFAEKSPAAYQYVSNRSLTNEQLNTLLAWMEDNQADGEVAAEYFLTEHEDLWTPWVSAEVAAKVKQALQ